MGQNSGSGIECSLCSVEVRTGMSDGGNDSGSRQIPDSLNSSTPFRCQCQLPQVPICGLDQPVYESRVRITQQILVVRPFEVLVQERTLRMKTEHLGVFICQTCSSSQPLCHYLDITSDIGQHR